MPDRDGRELGQRERGPRPRGDRGPRRRAARRYRDPAGRGPAPDRGEAAGGQGLCRAALRAGEPDRPAGLGQPEAALRHPYRRKILSRRAPGLRRSRHRRGQGGGARDQGLQAGHGLAAGALGRARLRRRAGGDPGRRGKARGDGKPAPRRALQLEAKRPAADRRQVRRGGELAAAGRRRAHPRDGRQGDRRAHRALPHERPDRRPAGRDRGQGARAFRLHARAPAQPLFLLRLPAQHIDQGARGQPGRGRHRLPLDGAADGPVRRDLFPYGGRGGELDRPGAVHRPEPRLRQSGGRHLPSFRHPRDPRRGACRGQRHLQGALQRRRRDDRRPAPARHPAADRGPGAGGRRRPGGRGRRPPRQVHRARAVPGQAQDPSPRRARPRPARAARDRRRHRADLRPDLRGRAAPPPQARHGARPGCPRVHQRGGVRRVRRLLGQVELRLDRAAGDQIRAQAPDQPILLQQGSVLRQRLLPELRHADRRPDPPGARRRRRAARPPRRPARARPAGAR